MKIYEHPFILTPSTWEGKGTITFNMSTEKLHFSTIWFIENDENGSIKCTQDIQIDDVPDKMINKMHITNISDNKFMINLTNEILGCINGTGLIDKKILAWEFRGNELDFEGFEIFERQEDDTYLTRSEFTSKDQMRTMIEGSIRLKKV